MASNPLAELEDIMESRKRILPRGKRCKQFLALAIAGESGELANVAKKEWRDGKDRSAKMRAEAKDVLAYTFMLGGKLGLTVTEMLAGTVQKLRAVEKRKSFNSWHRAFKEVREQSGVRKKTRRAH